MRGLGVVGNGTALLQSDALLFQLLNLAHVHVVDAGGAKGGLWHRVAFLVVGSRDYLILMAGLRLRLMELGIVWLSWELLSYCLEVMVFVFSVMHVWLSACRWLQRLELMLGSGSSRLNKRAGLFD